MKGLDFCYFVEPVSEYLSGHSLCMEWTNWSTKIGNYSDMYTSPGSK